MSKKKKSLAEIIDGFRYSDTIPATTAKFLLGFLAIAPILLVGAATPGILSATKSFQKRKWYSKKKVANAVRNLKQRKLIEIIEEKDGKIKVQLTNKGKKRIKDFYFDALSIEKPKKWDRKWRILIFDIPSKPKIFNQAREALRSKIKELGFHQMQKSVWVCPYECEDEILLVAELYKVQKHIEILTVEKMLHEESIKRKFNLS
jgi:DNA-binding transcriptional regulator PaaX